jgi:hypothetical protein
MHKKEDSAPQSDQPVSNSHNWIKKLTLILTSVLLLTMFGLGGYWVGERQQESSPIDLLTKLKSNELPTDTPIQQHSVSPTITTNQTDITIKWEAYANSKVGFEFRYPDKNYKLRHDGEIEHSKRSKIEIPKAFTQYMGYSPPQVLLAISIENERVPNSSYSLIPFALWIFKNSEEIEIDQWHETYWYYTKWL